MAIPWTIPLVVPVVASIRPALLRGLRLRLGDGGLLDLRLLHRKLAALVPPAPSGAAPVYARTANFRGLVLGCIEAKFCVRSRKKNRILQVNMRLKALAEIYTMHSFAPV